MVKPWGFDPQSINAHVGLWHGGEDADAPVAMGRWIAAALPNCQAHFLPDEGHISLIIKNAEMILTSLIPARVEPLMSRT